MFIQSFDIPVGHVKTSTRSVWVMVGFLLALCGQLTISEPQEMSFYKPLADFSAKWNDRFYLALKNPVNILAGLMLAICNTLVPVEWYQKSQASNKINKP